MIAGAVVASALHRLRFVRRNTLLLNALYLMLSTFVVAVSGLLFWIIVAHTYSVSTLGLATTLLSVSGLLSLLGLVGFDTTFVRFLPHTGTQNACINTGFLLVAITSTLLGMLAATILPLVVPSLHLLANPLMWVSFVFFTTATALNTLTNAVFLAYKRAGYILAINAAFSVVKVLLPLLITSGGAMTIFVLAGIVQLIGVALSIGCLRRWFGYHPGLRIDHSALRSVRRFSLSVYASSILNLAPPTVLPLLVVYYMGPSNAAYYYMAFTIASMLYMVAYAFMQSLFAEGSHNEQALSEYIRRATRLAAVSLLPALLLVVTLSRPLLAIFGPAYAQHAVPLLQLFALGAVPVAAYSALGAICKVTKNLQAVVAMNVIYVTTIVGWSYIAVPIWGLIAVGWGWIIGNVLACITSALLMTRKQRQGVIYGETSRAWR